MLTYGKNTNNLKNDIKGYGKSLLITMPYSKENMILKKEEINRKNRERYAKNKDKWNKTRNEKYKKCGIRYQSAMLNSWKRQNIIIFDNTLIKFLESVNCELCGVEYCEIGGKTKKNTKVLEHHHFSNYARFICCHSCNIKQRTRDNIIMKLHLELYRYFLSK